jgi:hypothetical protein
MHPSSPASSSFSSSRSPNGLIFTFISLDLP